LTQLDATKNDKSTESEEDVVDVINVELNARRMAGGYIGYIRRR
jgi:hypothetical protein